MSEPRPPIYPAPDDWPETRDYHREQAGEIERLRARVAELEAALRPFASAPDVGGYYADTDMIIVERFQICTCGDLRHARAALAKGETR